MAWLRERIWHFAVSALLAVVPVVTGLTIPTKIGLWLLSLLVIVRALQASREARSASRAESSRNRALERIEHHTMQDALDRSTGKLDLILSALAPGQKRPARTTDEVLRYRALRLDLAYWTQQATSMLVLDEPPLEVNTAIESAWISGVIIFEQTMVQRLTFHHHAILPDDQRRRLSPPPASLWKPGSAPQRGGHSELFCASYARLAQQRAVLLELVTMIDDDEGATSE